MLVDEADGNQTQSAADRHAPMGMTSIEDLNAVIDNTARKGDGRIFEKWGKYFSRQDLRIHFTTSFSNLKKSISQRQKNKREKRKIAFWSCKIIKVVVKYYYLWFGGEVLNGLERLHAELCRKKAIPTARVLLSREGNRTMLILSVLICAVASFLPTLVITWPLTYLIDWETLYEGNMLLYSVLYYAEWLVHLAFFFLTAPPLYLGLYRMAVRMSREESVGILDVFRYFSSKALYRRAIAIVLRTACFVLPVYFAGLLAVSTLGMEDGALLTALSLCLLAVVFLLCLFIFSLSGGYVTLAVLREDAPLSECRAMAREISRGRAWTNVIFLLSLSWRILLSLLTVGVVLLVHTLPMSMLASANYVGRQSEAVIDLNS